MRKLLGSSEGIDRAAAVVGHVKVAKLGLEVDTVGDVNLAGATEDLPLRVAGDNAGTRGDLAGVSHKEVLAVLAHEGNLVTILHSALLATRGHDLDVVVARRKPPMLISPFFWTSMYKLYGFMKVTVEP
jgi:hypothetical protein